MKIDLSTAYGGLILDSPIVVGASPMVSDEQTRSSLEAAGAGAVVLPSVFEEQVIRWTQKMGRPITEREQALLARSERFRIRSAGEGAEDYLALVERASSQLSIPVIASLNGYSANGWLDFAGELEQAGAAGVELNVYHAPVSDYRGSGEIEDSIVAAVGEVNEAISIPLFIKFERVGVSLPHLARRVCSGANGFVVYGRGPDTDICLESLKLKSFWSLTAPGSAIQLLNPIMRVHATCPAMSIAASGGIASCEDVIKVLLAGADVAMITSELYRSGPTTIRTLIDGLVAFLQRHHFKSLRDLQLHRPLEFANDQERVHYIAALSARLNVASPADSVSPRP
ncbi:dihydroorotate dehydrogenase 2 [Novipirellula galeiformis]|uniref:Dihydroorotate dehydrogenase 2 n=1 Tax=Novipirellula galeiformis TaxID=2528004 RepID=A0A5C6CE37_9BACT|nr:dihydroorotate dehydrogenase [Novipirellula galeiformis]TWU22285.1 dihydroorotate dehydrogenase 2 [Novipirellula galeiformis]